RPRARLAPSWAAPATSALPPSGRATATGRVVRESALSALLPVARWPCRYRDRMGSWWPAVVPASGCVLSLEPNLHTTTLVGANSLSSARATVPGARAAVLGTAPCGALVGLRLGDPNDEALGAWLAEAGCGTSTSPMTPGRRPSCRT